MNYKEEAKQQRESVCEQALEETAGSSRKIAVIVVIDEDGSLSLASQLNDREQIFSILQEITKLAFLDLQRIKDNN